jgi:hypothetical protein
MEAKAAHEAELHDLEVVISQSPNDHPTSPMRNYIRQRREELGIAFAEKAKLSPDSQARLDEIDALEAYLNGHGIGNDNPDQPMRAYVRQRRAALLAPPVVPPVPGPAPKPSPVPAGSVAPAPTFSPSGGRISQGQLITISDAVVGAAIHYTVDGSIPSPNGPSTKHYVAPFVLPASATINAMATASGYAPSPVSSVSYSY